MATFARASTFTREVAKRVFAEELRSSDLIFRESDDQYAPQYLLTPTGARCNRLFIVGTLTERDQIGEDTEYWRGRVVDPTGSVLVYAGQYQPEAAQVLANVEPPAFVAVVGKPNLYETEDGNTIVSIRAESIQEVDARTRDLWIVDAARHTLERLKGLSDLESNTGSPEEAEDRQKARLHYSTDIERYKQAVIGALESLKRHDEVSRPESFRPAAETLPSADKEDEVDYIEEIDFS
jgi:RPA family protein